MRSDKTTLKLPSIYVPIMRCQKVAAMQFIGDSDVNANLEFINLNGKVDHQSLQPHEFIDRINHSDRPFPGCGGEESQGELTK